jgi:hypothetical protein
MTDNQDSDLPVSAMRIDFCSSGAIAQWEKRSIAQEVPELDLDVSIECNQ